MKFWLKTQFGGTCWQVSLPFAIWSQLSFPCAEQDIATAWLSLLNHAVPKYKSYILKTEDFKTKLVKKQNNEKQIKETSISL